MVTLLHYRLKVTLNDGRSLVGHMLAYDKHMNFVLAECEEFRTVKGKKAKTAPADEPAPTVQQKRTLGLVILRGETIVSVSVEGPPPAAPEAKGIPAGPGAGVPAGRGMPLNAGAPAMAARPMPYARPPPGFPPGMPGLPPGMPPGFAGGLPPGMPPPMGMPPGFRPQGGPPPGFPPGFPGRPQ
ncbi:Small nuclear ribonucleoprotein-associated protein B [Cryptotrichosporon argae]